MFTPTVITCLRRLSNIGFMIMIIPFGRRYWLGAMRLTSRRAMLKCILRVGVARHSIAPPSSVEVGRVREEFGGDAKRRYLLMLTTRCVVAD